LPHDDRSKIKDKIQELNKLYPRKEISEHGNSEEPIQDAD